MLDSCLAVALERCEVRGNGLPDRVLVDVRVVVAQTVAETAYLGPRLIGGELLGKQAELDGGLTDAGEAALARVTRLAISGELRFVHAGDVGGDGVDVFDDVVEAIDGVARRQGGGP